MKIPKPVFYGACAVFVATWFGLVGPYMISSESDALVLGWILLTTAGAVYAFHSITKRIKK